MRRVERALEDRVVPTTTLTLDVGVNNPIVQANPTKTVKVFIDVGTLDQAAGISSAQFYVKYDPAMLSINELTFNNGNGVGTPGSDIQFGPLFTGSAGYSLGEAGGSAVGLVGVDIENTGGTFYTGTLGGKLVELDFHVNQTATVGMSTLLDIRPSGGSGLSTFVGDQSTVNYTFSPPLKTYPASAALTQTGALAPVAFNPSDTDANDAAIQVVAGTPVVTPAVTASKYVMAVAAPGSGASLPLTMTVSGLANGVLQGMANTNAFLVGGTAGTPTTIGGAYSPTWTFTTTNGGSVTLNELDGSFTYTPVAGFIGVDSFSFTAGDAVSGTQSAPATATIQVGSTISIPKTLTVSTASPTVVVPVMIDNPNPANSGGLAAVTLGINYDSTKFTVSSADVTKGTLTSGALWNNTTINTQTPGQIVFGEFPGTTGTPITSTAPGSLALITLHLIAGTSSGTSVINLSKAVPAPSALNGGIPGTPSMALFPAPVDNPTLAGAGSADDGSIAISGTSPTGTATTTTVSTSNAAPTNTARR